MELNQWSIKLDNGEIFMIQRGSMEELLKAKEAYMQSIMDIDVPQVQEEEPPMPTEEPKAFGGATYVCNDCGSKATLVEGTSKKGNYYKGIKCTKDSQHFRFLSD